MEIYTIGLAKKSALDFFESLKQARIARLVDIRLNNTSQLAGFTKRDDLRYFLDRTCGADYRHELLLSVGLTRPFAPSPDAPPIHWLQVNNIHLEPDPCWRLR